VCKKSIKNSQPFVKKNEKCQDPAGGGVDSHCTPESDYRPTYIGIIFSSAGNQYTYSIGLVITWNQNK